MLNLPSRYICPSCWGKFEPEKTHWIATSDELQGDDRLSDVDFKRFLPRHFTPDFKAVDEHGGHCQQKACPYCHLEIPDGYFEAEPFFASIVGGRASGKSHFIVSLINWLKNELPIYGLHCEGEPSREMNHIINERIESLFTPTNEQVALEGDKLVANAVPVNMPRRNAPDQFDEYQYPLPAMYSMISKEANSIDADLYYLCLYDHSGEDFEPGQDNPKQPLTKHIGNSDALLFIIDPTQDINFVKKYNPNYSQDDLATKETIGEASIQERVLKKPLIVFTEMSRRIRANYKNSQNIPLSIKVKYDRPIVVVVTKCDAWGHLLEKETQEALKTYPIVEGTGIRALSKSTIQMVSDNVHGLIQPFFQDLVNSIDRFGSDVMYIPVSATGKQPTKDEFNEPVYIAGTLEPKWVGVPFLYALAKHKQKLVEMK